MVWVTEHVNLLDKEYKLVSLTPGMLVPDWAVSLIGDHAVTDIDPNAVQVDVVDGGDSEHGLGYEGLKKTELTKLLKQRSLPVNGTVAQMRQRLMEADGESVKVPESKDTGSKAKAAADGSVWALSDEQIYALARKQGIDYQSQGWSVQELAAILDSGTGK